MQMLRIDCAGTLSAKPVLPSPILARLAARSWCSPTSRRPAAASLWGFVPALGVQADGPGSTPAISNPDVKKHHGPAAYCAADKATEE
jgi:hypothetical protein